MKCRAWWDGSVFLIWPLRSKSGRASGLALLRASPGESPHGPNLGEGFSLTWPGCGIGTQREWSAGLTPVLTKQGLQTWLLPLLRNMSLDWQARLCSLLPEPLPGAGSCPGKVWAGLAGMAGGLVNLDPREPGWGLRPAEQGSVAVGDRSLWAELWTQGCLGLGAGLGCGVDREGPTPGSSSALSPVLLPVEMMAVFFLRAREPSILPVTGWLTACLLEQDCVCLSLSCVLTLCNSKEPTRLLCPWGFPRRE